MGQVGAGWCGMGRRGVTQLPQANSDSILLLLTTSLASGYYQALVKNYFLGYIVFFFVAYGWKMFYVDPFPKIHTVVVLNAGETMNQVTCIGIYFY